MSELSEKGLRSGAEQKTTENQIVNEEIIIIHSNEILSLLFFSQLKSPTNYASAVPVYRMEVK